LWGSHSGSGAPVPAGVAQKFGPAEQRRHLLGGEQLEPLSRRLLRTAAGLSLLLILVVANSLLHGDGENPLNPVAAAAERTENVPGGRLSLYIVYSSPATARSVTASGSGVFNSETDRSRVELEMNSPVTGPLRVVTITDGDHNYDGGDIVREKLPPGKEWVRTDSDEENGENSLDMDDSLRVLSSSGGVQVVGHETVDGKMTRRYRGEIQLAQLVEFLREEGKDDVADSYERIEGLAPTGISAEAWVDRNDMLRRFRMVMPMPGDPGEPPLTVDMRMDVFDYGIRPDIQLPDPDSVVDGPLDDDEAPAPASFS
jgi:hypothetical protein